MRKITIVAGARPNFIKIAPIIHAIENTQKKGLNISYRLVHTGQHYDENMSGSFFQQLEIPQPHINLDCNGGSQAELTASIILAFEKELIANPTDIVLVVGDVTSTMACALVAQKLGIKVAHVEAGIRSNDWSMPEEINRLVTDSISNFFFTTSETANSNLIKAGVDEKAVFFVGNTMIDTLLKQRSSFKKPKIWTTLNLVKGNFIVMTLHRPSNVDQESKLKEMINEIVRQTRNLPILFPVHPRTARVLKRLNINYSQLHIIDPLSYLEFNYLVERSKAIITDSGGVTEEASILDVPCLTIRDTTERPETITLGTNELVGTDPKQLNLYLELLFNNQWKKGQSIPLWDGKTAERIVDVLMKLKI